MAKDTEQKKNLDATASTAETLDVATDEEIKLEEKKKNQKSQEASYKRPSNYKMFI